MLGVEPDYLLYSKVFPHWTPFPNGAAMLPIKYSLQMGSKGDLTVKVMFNLGFFALEGNPSLYMRELYYVYVDLYSE